MTGSALLDFFIGILLLVAAGAIFFLTIDKVVPDPLLAKIGKIVVGVLGVCLVLIFVWAVFFGGGKSMGMTPLGLVHFAVGMLVVIAVCFILSWIINFFGFMVGELQYLLGILALIAILVLAGDVMTGGKVFSVMGGRGLS